MAMQIKLMTDYECWPLWWVGGERVGNIDPSTLPISNALRERLAAWVQRYDATLNRNDPLQSGFATEAEEMSFEHEGVALWKALRQELRPKYEVSYFSNRLRQVFATPDSFPE